VPAPCSYQATTVRDRVSIVAVDVTLTLSKVSTGLARLANVIGVVPLRYWTRC
jgi:hypothetical protein